MTKPVDNTLTVASPQIFPLMGEAMRRISAIGKDSVNKTQGFKYRGIDAVMNMLYPVMSELGLFIVPEVLEQTREERTSTKSYWDDNEKKYNEKKTTLLYSLLKVKYTMYAPDGSNVSAVVIGEGMDSGDKASNKALAVALKYACFQMFMIPTEDMIDPDSESHEVDPKKPETPKTTTTPATVETAKALPQKQPETSPVLEYLARERQALQVAREVTAPENMVIWKKQIAELTKAGIIPNKKLSEFTQAEAENMIAAMYKNFEVCGTELKK